MFLVTNIDVEKGTKVDDNEEGVEITHKQKKMLMELGEKISEVSLDIFRVLMLFWNSSTLYASYLWSSCLLSLLFWHKKACGLQ